jgi:hypothetical protein
MSGERDLTPVELLDHHGGIVSQGVEVKTASRLT